MIRYVRGGSDNTKMEKIRAGSHTMDKLRDGSDNTDNIRLDKVMKDNRLTQ